MRHRPISLSDLPAWYGSETTPRCGCRQEAQLAGEELIPFGSSTVSARPHGIYGQRLRSRNGRRVMDMNG